MPKLAEKQATKFVAARAVTTQPSQPTKATSSNDQGGRLSKQARVVEMLHSPTGTTVAAVMKATGWQQHSVRGFFAGVVRKRLGLDLRSEKIDGERDGTDRRPPGSVQQCDSKIRRLVDSPFHCLVAPW